MCVSSNLCKNMQWRQGNQFYCLIGLYNNCKINMFWKLALTTFLYIFEEKNVRVLNSSSMFLLVVMIQDPLARLSRLTWEESVDCIGVKWHSWHFSLIVDTRAIHLLLYLAATDCVIFIELFKYCHLYNKNERHLVLIISSSAHTAKLSSELVKIWSTWAYDNII